MKKILLALLFMGSSLFAQVGEEGSKVESEEIKLEVKLIKDDNTSITILDGTKYLRLNGQSETNTSIGQALEGTKPPAGTYTHIQWTPKGFRTKAKVKIDDIFYYTQNITVPEDDTTPWQVTDDKSKYGKTIIESGGNGTVTATATVTVKFPQPLIVTDDKPVELYTIVKFGNDVQYGSSDGSIENIRDIGKEMTNFLFTSTAPAKKAYFVLEYLKGGTTYKNGISLFFDKNDNLIGAYSSEGADGAMHGGFVLKANDLGNNQYKLIVWDDPDESGQNEIKHEVSFTLDCSNSTYSNLSVNQWANDMQGGTLTENGTATCSDINIVE